MKDKRIAELERERDEALARVEHVTSDRDRLVVQVAALQRTNYSANAD